MKANILRIPCGLPPSLTEPGVCEELAKDLEGTVFYVATLSRVQFEIARRHIRAFADFENFNDWENSRQWWQFGLSLAGVEALVVNVDIPLFARECERVPLNPPQPVIRRFLDAQQRSFDG